MTAHTPYGTRPGRRAVVPLTVVSALVAGAALSGCGQQRDDDVYTLLNSWTDVPYHRWDGQTLARCSKKLGITIEPAPMSATGAR